MDVTLEILKYILPALIVFLVSYLTIKAFLQRETKLKELEIRKSTRGQTIPLRLQAYERMALFTERLKFVNLLQRVKRPNITVRTFQIELIQTIRSEFEHNMSQQIYMSQSTWNLITLGKDQMINIINMASAQCPPDAASDHLSKVIINMLMTDDVTEPTEKAMEAIHEEAKSLF